MPFRSVMTRALALGAGLGMITATWAGAVRGQVRILEAQTSSSLVGTNTAGNLSETLKTNLPNLRDFVVFIDGDGGTNFPTLYKPVTIQLRRDANQNPVFSPHVLPVLVGTTVEWRNDDSVYHKLFSLSDNATFEFPLFKHGDPSPQWTFAEPGPVDVFCSIHANMSGVVLVLENPWFTGTDFRNNFFIQNVPAGTYKLKLWHERVPTQVQEITVPAEGEVKANFDLDPANLPAT